jgi:hypothetical protein
MTRVGSQRHCEKNAILSRLKVLVKSTSINVHQDQISTPTGHILQSPSPSMFINEISTEAINVFLRKLIISFLLNPYLVVLFTHSSVE